MVRLLVSVFVAVNFWINAAIAQDQEAVWVQIEAQPSLSKAQERVRDFSSTLPDVNGFALGGGWYAIALGPYTPNDAREVLRVYRSEGQIPRDSYIAYTASFRQQFWPIGANFLETTPDEAVSQVIATETSDPAQDSELADVATEPEIDEITPDESLAEARATEAKLGRLDREKLQLALQWAGLYDGSIDGAFGRGTRSSMAAWQSANNHQTTGVLTTAQRNELFAQYNAILSELGVSVIEDITAGIAIKIPTKVVKLSKYSAPFAHYDSIGDINGRVLLISQQGDKDTLYGLYDILQTLEIVPENGPRERKDNSFILVGEGATFISHTQVWLENKEIKGFTLVWPAGDEERRSRLLGEMLDSFTRLDGAMDASEGTDDQSIDLVAGLEIRKPKLSRSGFFLDQQGHILTTSEAVTACSRITIENAFEGKVVANDAAAGIAILKSIETLSPTAVALLAESDANLRTEVAVSGFSYEGMLGAPTLTFGLLGDVKGLNGEHDIRRLELNALSGDAGGPVFDETGAILGMLLPSAEDGRKLPELVSFAVGAATIQRVVQTAGLKISNSIRTEQIAPEDLTEEAQALTVLISCWE